MSARQQAFLIKGYLLANNAPVPVMTAIELILHELDGTKTETITQDLKIVKDLSPERLHDFIKNVGAVQEKLTINDQIPYSPEGEEIEDPKEAEDAPPPEKRTRGTKITDDEKRKLVQMREAGISFPDISAAVGRPMVSMQAIFYKMKREGELHQYRSPKIDSIPTAENLPAQGAASKPPTVTRVDIIPNKLKQEHDEYIGQRKPGQGLTEEDWADIQRMMQKNGSKAHVAKLAEDYGVPAKEMENFIGEHILREARESDARRKKRAGSF